MSEATLDVDAAVARLKAATVPAPVLEVAERLQAAGHHAVLVGGCVRDILLGREHGDWDLASSARPEEVQALFKRTIGTGLEHGTVTVMVGRGDAREGVEVTTFRGEGTYVDGRRPTEVTFLRDLEADLARRDFTINALAWDPVQGVFTDVYGGLSDLGARRIRAVGVALERFLEDGLRVMRAVRFAATLAFDIDTETEAAIEGALEVFDKVSRERVQVELFKLLGAQRCAPGLEPMLRRALWPRVLGPADEAAAKRAIAHCDARPARVDLRLAGLLRDTGLDVRQASAVLEGLKPPKRLRAYVLHMLTTEFEALGAADASQAELRRAASRVGRTHVDDALWLLLASDEARTAAQAAMGEAALSVKELAIAGRDLLGEGVMKPGPKVGDVLEALLDEVLEDPARNTREALLERARELAAQS